MWLFHDKHTAQMGQGKPRTYGDMVRLCCCVVVDGFVTSTVQSGKVHSRVTCDTCHRASDTFQPFSCLSVPMPRPAEGERLALTLPDLLKQYFSEESVDYACCMGMVCGLCV